MNQSTMKLHVLAFGLAIGVAWGIGMLLTGLLSLIWGYGQAFITAMGSVYVGFSPTLFGSFIGGVYGFIDGFVFGVILAWLYNYFTSCCCKKACEKDDD